MRNWFRDTEREQAEAAMREAFQRLSDAVATGGETLTLTQNQRVQLSEMFRRMARLNVTIGEIERCAKAAAAAFD